MPISYKIDLLAPEALPAYKAAHVPGVKLTLPDLKNPAKSIVYTIEDIQIEEAPPHPKTGEPLNRVTLVLKN
jgi:hypothetical protein